MTCAHVLGLIDAGPFADYPQEHLDAARAHARGCPTCGPALEAATVMTAELRALPGPDAPGDLASIVMARIAQLPDAGSAVAAAVRQPDWTQTLTVLGGLVAGLALILTMPTGAEALGGFVTPRFSAAGALATVPASAPAALAIGAGLLMYVAGLFGPVRSES
ncbi:MAG TPA: hypothetical protein VMS54_12930 [Vicinamibacterales bacterium]|nr:hypothetical protein [Vicinamibacterales bacterium]